MAAAATSHPASTPLPPSRTSRLPKRTLSLREARAAQPRSLPPPPPPPQSPPPPPCPLATGSWSPDHVSLLLLLSPGAPARIRCASRRRSSAAASAAVLSCRRVASSGLGRAGDAGDTGPGRGGGVADDGCCPCCCAAPPVSEGERRHGLAVPRKIAAATLESRVDDADSECCHVMVRRGPIVHGAPQGSS